MNYSGVQFLGLLLLLVRSGAAALAPVTIDYPEPGSLFPPEITAPTFLWRDPARGVTLWRVDISFGDGSPALRVFSHGERMRVGEIDPDCVSETNQPPSLTPLQAAAHTWKPEPALWRTIQAHSRASAASFTIRGLGAGRAVLSRGRVSLQTSKDPAGAPIFYRDVPLMPTETEKGVIKPLAPQAVRLIRWRLRDLSSTSSRVVMEALPVCANCHSFSRDGKTLGMDLDGLQNNKGMYTLTPLARQTSIGNQNVIQWKSDKGQLKGGIRVGFMSQVSPDGSYVATTINPAPQVDQEEPPSNYYVANFKDYRFLQVFYPTRGILAWYSRASGVLQPLPGADDPRHVQMGAVWSPDGRYLVFARAEACDPNPPGLPLAKFSGDPNERPMRYGLYRIPFNEGRGGQAEPIAGASANGISNTFPKVSPDGKWIVYVQCRNGQLMRPDSRLFIVPAAGGTPRLMRCNGAPMNSWHSFSPNGRWLAFSSKRRSPYTQLYLTHIDEQGNDSPAILVENTTAANRAVNLPEFVNIPPDGLERIGGPALDYYRLFDRALYLQKVRRLEESAKLWRQALELKPGDAAAEGNLGIVLLLAGRRDQAVGHLLKAREERLRKAIESSPNHAPAYDNLGAMLLDSGRADEAGPLFAKAIAMDARLAPAHAHLARALALTGRLDQALAEAREAITLDPGRASSYHALGLVLARQGDPAGAIVQFQKAVELDPKFPEPQAELGRAYQQQGNRAQALVHYREALRLRSNDPASLERIAWLLATSSESSLRNGPEAVSAAVKALTLSGGKDPRILDTLAAAYAEAGRFEDATATARRALDLVPEADRAPIRARIALYASGKPFRE